MIEDSLIFAAQQFNQHLKLNLGTDEDVMVVGNLGHEDDEWKQSIENRLVMLVTHISPEPVARNLDLPQRGSDGRVMQSTRPLNLAVEIMVVSNFSGKSYLQGLKYLSETVKFYNARPELSSESAQGLPQSIEWLTIEMQDRPFENLGLLWQALGNPHMPSIHYKMRLLTLPEIEREALPGHVVRAVSEVSPIPRER